MGDTAKSTTKKAPAKRAVVKKEPVENTAEETTSIVPQEEQTEHTENHLSASHPEREMAHKPDQHHVNAYYGVALKPFQEKEQKVLMDAIDDNDVEIRPDGIVYYPEIKYRRRLNTAFGPGAWGLVPRSKHEIMGSTLVRQYALIVHGRFVAEAAGEGEYYPDNGNMSFATVTEGVKSNALMRCCKDLGIASELWDPGFIADWKNRMAIKLFVDGPKGTKALWRRWDRPAFGFPQRETGIVPDSPNQDKYVPANNPPRQNNGSNLPQQVRQNAQRAGQGAVQSVTGQVVNRPPQQAQPAPQPAAWVKPLVEQTDFLCEQCQVRERPLVVRLKKVTGIGQNGKPYKFYVCDEKDGGCGFRSFHDSVENRTQEAIEKNVNLDEINI